jgi:flagellin
MPVIGSTTSGASVNNINNSFRTSENSLKRLGSGSKAATPAGNAAALAVAAAMQADVSALRQSSTNTVQGLALLGTADGGLERVGGMLNRMKELATQANSGSLDSQSRAAINVEYQNLVAEVNNTVASTTFNGTALIDGSYNQNFQAGSAATDVVSANLSSVNATGAGLGLTAGAGLSPTALTTQAGAAAVGAELDTAIANLSNMRSTVGSIQSQFTFRGDLLDTQTNAMLEATSALVDVDIARESSNFAGSSLLSQLSIATLAQTNQMKTSSMLGLLRR